MPITSVSKDLGALTMTVVADFHATRQRLWEAYTDPRQIEKFWGPVEWPATFTRHDVYPGGRSHYYMTGPDGDRSAGFWEFLSVTQGEAFEVLDGFAAIDGTPHLDMPTMRMTFAFDETAAGSRMTCTTHFASIAELEQLLAHGMEEGLTSAMSQIDTVLADLASFAAGSGTHLQLLNDTQVRVSRIIRGTVDQVWRAHTEAALIQRWQLGPDGWSMPICKVAAVVGSTYHYGWTNDADPSQAFGFTGQLLEMDPPHRSVTTEAMVGMDGPSTLNELTLTPTVGGTLMSLVITYPDAGTRDSILATGMVDGMEASYRRLESVLG